MATKKKTAKKDDQSVNIMIIIAAIALAVFLVNAASEERANSNNCYEVRKIKGINIDTGLNAYQVVNFSCDKFSTLTE